MSVSRHNGDIAPHISTLLIGSSSVAPEQAATQINVAYLITALPEPGSLWLMIAGCVGLAFRRRCVS